MIIKINEPYKFQNTKSEKKLKEWKNVFNNTMKTVLLGLNM